MRHSNRKNSAGIWSYLYLETPLFHSGTGWRKQNHISDQKQTGSTSHASTHFCEDQATSRSERKWHAETLSFQQPNMIQYI